MKMLEKSTPPVTTPIGGMMMSSTSDLTMVEKAAPMITPTAMSITLPRSANSLNSFSIAAFLLTLSEPYRQEASSLPCSGVKPNRSRNGPSFVDLPFAKAASTGTRWRRATS
jgi:hypothetical protein